MVRSAKPPRLSPSLVPRLSPSLVPRPSHSQFLITCSIQNWMVGRPGNKASFFPRYFYWRQGYWRQAQGMWMSACMTITTYLFCSPSASKSPESDLKNSRWPFNAECRIWCSIFLMLFTYHMYMCCISLIRRCPQIILYSRKLSRNKTFTNFAVLWLFAKVLFTKFGGMVSFGVAKVSNLWKFSLQKSYFSPIHESFLPQKFPAIR